jgi:hypothetical protein
MEIDLSRLPRYVPQWTPPNVPKPGDADYSMWAIRNGCEETLADYWAQAKSVRG